MPAATITCPECHKTFKGKVELDGKKVRCPRCQEVFKVQMGETLKVDLGGAQEREAIKAAPAKKSRPAPLPESEPDAVPPPPEPVATAKPPAPPPAPGLDLDLQDEDNPNPYGVTTIDLRPRCPNCANPLEDDEAVVCLHCGYNTQTRAAVRLKKTVETTHGDRFSWLMPGFISAGGMLLLILLLLFYCVTMPDILGDSFLVSESVRMWLTLILLAVMWPLGRYATNRLVFNPTPPEKVKSEG
jgi:predicted Zn finger-like uncharacterized protein